MDTCSKILPEKTNPNTHDDTHSVNHTRRTTGHHYTHSNKSPSHSWDSGVCVHMELNSDDLLPCTELEKTSDHKKNNESDSPKISPRPDVENNNGEVAEGDQDVNYIADVIPEVNNRKGLMPPSPLALPPPLPPRHHQRSSALEKAFSQGPQLKASIRENEPLHSLVCQTSPVLGRVKGSNLCLDLVPGAVPDMCDGSKGGILPKGEPNVQTQVSPRPPRKPPIKPPRCNIPKRAEETEKGKQKAECRQHREKMGHECNRHEQDLTERNEKAEENEETSQTESNLDMGKPPQQILVLFADMEEGWEEGENWGKEDEDPSSTTPSTAENSSQLAMACSDLTPDEEPLIAANNRNCTSTVSAMIPPNPPPKPHQKCLPKLPFKPPQLLSAMRVGIELEKERRKQEDKQWRDTDLVDRERGEREGEGKDRGKINGDTEPTTPTMTEMPSQIVEIVIKSIPKSSVNQEVQLPRGEQRFDLKPPRRNRPTSVITPENQTLLRESQHPGKQHQNSANGQVQPGPLQQEVTARVSPIGTVSNGETLKWTDKNKDIQRSGQEVQDSEVISKLPSRHLEEMDVVRTKLDPCWLELKRLEGIAETLPDGELKQTNQKTNARGMVKQLAKKVLGRLKGGREEKRRMKVEMKMDGVRDDDIDLTEEERRDEEERGIKDEEEGKGERVDEVDVDQSAVAETQSHADLLERTTERRHATSDSFSSFRECSPVKLVEDLLSGDEWSQFLYREQSSTPDPLPHLIHSEDTGQLSVDQFNSGAELDLTLDVFEDHVYEDIDLSNMMTEQQINRAPIIATTKILVESETNVMSPRTKDVYDTVELMEPVKPTSTCANFSDIKSQGVLGCAAQKYLIKLSKKRKHKTVWKRRGHSSHGSLGQSPSSTSPQQVYTASIFYKVPASGGDEPQQLSTVKLHRFLMLIEMKGGDRVLTASAHTAERQRWDTTPLRR